MIDYLAKAATAWFLGFFPFFEILLAIPAAVALGLDYVSAGFWAAFGNFVAVPVIVLFHRQLQRLPALGPWLRRQESGRSARLLNRYGGWIVLVATPWIGVWAVAAAAKVAGMRASKLLLFSLISIAVYAALITGGIALGLDYFTG